MFLIIESILYALRKTRFFIYLQPLFRGFAPVVQYQPDPDDGRILIRVISRIVRARIGQEFPLCN